MIASYTAQKFTTDARLERIELKLNAYIEINSKGSEYYDTRLQTMELRVQEISTSLQKTQLEIASMK